MSNSQVNQAMEDAAKYLNIKPHRVTDTLITIHSPIGNWNKSYRFSTHIQPSDIEVHAAHDNNYYVRMAFIYRYIDIVLIKIGLGYCASVASWTPGQFSAGHVITRKRR